MCLAAKSLQLLVMHLQKFQFSYSANVMLIILHIVWSMPLVQYISVFDLRLSNLAPEAKPVEKHDAN